jgi:hypothetical protein
MGYQRKERGKEIIMPKLKPVSEKSEASTKPNNKKEASRQPLKNVEEILTELNTSPTLLEPMVEEGSSQVIIHSQVLLLEFNSPQLLEEVLQVTPIARFVVRRVGDAAMMVDYLRKDELFNLLTKKGYEPKIVTMVR